MHTAARRFCAIILAILLGLPAWVQAADMPVAWLALRSYQRLEQRLRDFATMANTPGLADILLGMVQLQLAGLGGLDRQRPLGIIVPTVQPTGIPPFAVVLPYTEKDAMLHTLRGFFPQTLVEEGGRLSLQGGPLPAFGHLHPATNTVIVATAPEIATGVNLSMPADLFGAQDAGPDLVLRVDLDGVKQQLQQPWQAMLANLEQLWQQAAQTAAASPGASAADQEAMTAYMRTIHTGIRHSLDDLSRGEARVTLASSGWRLDLESRMRPGSPSATFLNQQAGHASRAPQLFSGDAAFRMVSHLRLTETIRQTIQSLLPSVRKMLETRLAALPDLTPERREAGHKAMTAYLSLINTWLTQKDVESALEVHLPNLADIGLTSWTPFPNGASSLGTILDIMEHIPLLTGQAAATVQRNVLQHRKTALHRLDLPRTQVPDTPGTMFLAASGPYLTFHFGTSPDPLKGLLDRIQSAAAQPPTQTDALWRLELFLAPILRFAAQQGQLQDPASQAMAARLQQGGNEPLLLELLTGQDSATLRYITPGPIVQGIAEVAGQHIMQQLRGGGSGQGGGSNQGGKSGKPVKPQR